MIRRIVRMQCLKLFHSADFVGFNVIGNILALFFGWLIVVNSGVHLTNRELISFSISDAFSGALLLWICMYGCTLIKEITNKTVNYEKMHGVRDSAMLIGRGLIPVMNSILFCLIAFLYQWIASYCLSFFSPVFLAALTEKMLLTLLCALHINIVMLMYFYATKNIIGGSILTFIFQWIIPRIASDSKYFCVSQMVWIWRNEISGSLWMHVITSLFAECGIVFAIVCIWNRRREWR